MSLLRLAGASLLNRWPVALLTTLAIALSVTLLLGVERIRTGARDSFVGTVSGTDLIVGARGGALNLLLYSVFRIGSPTNNITWASYQDVAAHPDVAWIVPLSLGDSHFGFRVLGTNGDYFRHYRYRDGRPLRFAAGGPFMDLFDAVLGAEVAARLGYTLGREIVVAHGLGREGFARHDDKPFRVAGILERTGTPVDRTVHVSLEAIEAIHVDWQGGAPVPGRRLDASAVRAMDLRPRAVTAALVGLDSRLATFRVQRFVNEYRAEPLLAILPGATLQELWAILGTAEQALSAVTVMVVATALLGMVTMTLASLAERRREMAILRSVGAGPRTILGLLTAEALLLGLAGTALGVLLLYAGLLALQPAIDSRYGLYLAIGAPSLRELGTLAGIVAAGTLAGLIPAWRAYRMSVADGMTVRT